MELTHHWIQRAGARAAAALTGRPGPAQVGAAELDRVVARIVDDAVSAAHAPKNGPGYAWWLALAAAYPNSPVVHPSRGRSTAEELRTKLDSLFTDDAGARWYCWCCDQPAAQRWGKSLWPLTNSASYLNDAPGGVGGQPVCRSCRICAWAMPYASSHNGAQILTVDTDDEDLAMELARTMVERNLRALADQWPAWPRAWTTAALVPALRAHPAELTSHDWRNDNRDPFIYERNVDIPTARWWAHLSRKHQAAIEQAADERPVWSLLSEPRMLHTRSAPLLHTLVEQARTAALEELAEGSALGERSQHLAEAARPLLESPYLGERGLEPLAGVLDPLAETVANLTAEPHLLEWFLNHRGDMDAWRTWLKKQAVQRLFGDGPPLITPEQWVQLFGDGPAAAARDHLVVGVLLHHHRAQDQETVLVG